MNLDIVTIFYRGVAVSPLDQSQFHPLTQVNIELQSSTEDVDGITLGLVALVDAIDIKDALLALEPRDRLQAAQNIQKNWDRREYVGNDFSGMIPGVR